MKVSLEQWVEAANSSRKQIKELLIEVSERMDNLRESQTLLTKRVYKLENPPIPAVKGTKRGPKKVVKK